MQNLAWNDPLEKIELEKLLGISITWNRKAESGKVIWVKEGRTSLSPRPYIYCHPHDYIWMVYRNDPELAHKVVMADIQDQIEKAAHRAEVKLTHLVAAGNNNQFVRSRKFRIKSAFDELREIEEELEEIERDLEMIS